MKTTLVSRTAANVRAALTIVAFTVLAAVGFATAHSLRPVTQAPVESSTPSIHEACVMRKNLHAAPAACPMPASAFTAR